MKGIRDARFASPRVVLPVIPLCAKNDFWYAGHQKWNGNQSVVSLRHLNRLQVLSCLSMGFAVKLSLDIDPGPHHQ